MESAKIRLHGLSEVKEFVNAASKCDFDIDIYYNRIIIDAKSILGILSMDLSRELNVDYAGHNEEFEAVLDKFSTGSRVA